MPRVLYVDAGGHAMRAGFEGSIEYVRADYHYAKMDVAAKAARKAAGDAEVQSARIEQLEAKVKNLDEECDGRARHEKKQHKIFHEMADAKVLLEQKLAQLERELASRPRSLFSPREAETQLKEIRSYLCRVVDEVDNLIPLINPPAPKVQREGAGSYGVNLGDGYLSIDRGGKKREYKVTGARVEFPHTLDPISAQEGETSRSFSFQAERLPADRNWDAFDKFFTGEGVAEPEGTDGQG